MKALAELPWWHSHGLENGEACAIAVLCLFAGYVLFIFRLWAGEAFWRWRYRPKLEAAGLDRLRRRRETAAIATPKGWGDA